MKIDATPRDVAVMGMASQREFTIKAGAHIMAVLSGLYKNPADAMVREYLTNMHDAMVALQREDPKAKILPCVLHLPTMLDSNLTFRDNGIGMDYDQAWNTFTQYGNSTKNGSNDEVGGFGLGSKTAFCYNDGASWTIETRKNGKRHVFMAFVGKDGIPNMTHVVSEDTKEHSGVTISIPIRKEDIRAVYEAARRYVPHFPSPLTVEADGTDKWGPISYYLQGKTWGLSKGDPHQRNSTFAPYRGTAVIMGNVPYRIDWSSMNVNGHAAKILSRFSKTYNRNSRLINFLAHNAFDFIVPIGAVDIVPSRDDMKYTDRTLTAIGDAIAGMLGDFEKSLSDKLSACTTEYAAMMEYAKQHEIQYLLDVVDDVKWNGKKLDLPKGIPFTVASIEKFAKKNSATAVVLQLKNSETSRPATLVDPKATVRLALDQFQNRYVDEPNKLHVIFGAGNDVKRQAEIFIFDKFVAHTANGRANAWGHRPVSVVVFENSKMTKKEISDFFGGLPEININEVDELQPDQMTIPIHMRPTKDTIYRWNGQAFDTRIKIPTDGKKKFYYVIMKAARSGRYTFGGQPTTSANQNMRDLVNRAVNLKLFEWADVTIYGVREDQEQKFIDLKWVSLATKIETETNKILTPDVIERLKLYRALGQRQYNSSRRLETFMNLHKTFDFPIKEIVAIKKVHEKIQGIQADAKLQNLEHILLANPDLNQKAMKMMDKVKLENIDESVVDVIAKYPMIGMLVTIVEKYGYYGHEVTQSLKRDYSKFILDNLK